MMQPGLFDMENRLESLSKFGDPLEKLKEIVDFEVFRSEIEEGLDFSDRTKGGRPPYDAILVFKILILQTLKVPEIILDIFPDSNGKTFRVKIGYVGPLEQRESFTRIKLDFTQNELIVKPLVKSKIFHPYGDKN